MSLQPWCVGDLLFVGMCPGTTEPTCPLPLSLCSVSELINVLTSVRRARHFWSPCSPAAVMRCLDLSAAPRGPWPAGSEGLCGSHLASAASPAHPAVPCCPLPSGRCGGWGQPWSWGPVHRLHVNVFKAISGLAIIPTASGDKYSRGLKSPSGRQAVHTGECADGVLGYK